MYLALRNGRQHNNNRCGVIIMITSAKYIAATDPAGNKSNSSIKATINGKEVFVPLVVGNKDYDAIQLWVEEGNTIEAAD